MSELRFDVGAFSTQGLRSYQEDAFAFEVGPSVAVFAVADGLGGHPNGDLASKAAVASVVGLAQLPTVPGEEGTPDIATLTRNVTTAAHWAVLETGGLTTLAMVAVAGSRVVVAHAGDSRVYLLRNGVLEQLTRDHRNGRHRLVRCLGVTRRDCGNETDVQGLDAQPGDVLALLTDGVSDTLDVGDMRDILRELPTLDARWAAETLVRRALAQDGRGNCTALVVRVGGGR